MIWGEGLEWRCLVLDWDVWCEKDVEVAGFTGIVIMR